MEEARAKAKRARAVCQIVHFPNGNLNAFLSNNSGGMSERGERGERGAQRAPYDPYHRQRRLQPLSGLAQCAKALSYERSLSKEYGEGGGRGANEGKNSRVSTLDNSTSVRPSRMMRICVMVLPVLKNGARLMLERWNDDDEERNWRWRWHRL